MALKTSSFEQFASPTEGAFDAAEFRAALATWLEPMRLECSPPFLVDWYNKCRSEVAGGTQQIEAQGSAVAFALYSVPNYLDVVVDHFARERPTDSFVDKTTNAIFSQLRSELPPSLGAELVNTDLGPPYYHVQTIGAIAGVDQHLELQHLQAMEGQPAWEEELSDRLEESRDPKMWGAEAEMRRKIFAVNVHPAYGGWYAYRGLLVLRNATQPSLPKSPLLEFVALEDARRIIFEYNLRHEQCLWRDLTSEGHPPHRRYSAEEYFFFTETSPAKRKRFLELKASLLTNPPPGPRWER